MQDVVTAVDERFGAPGAKKRIPVVLTRTEVQTVLVKQEGQNKVKASLLEGLRHVLAGGLRLRVKNVDFERKTKVKPATVKQKSSSEATYA